MELIPLNIDLALFTLRLALGVLFLAQGPAKLANSAKIAKKLHLSQYSILAIGLAESMGAVLLIFGIWPRFGAFLLLSVMLGAIYLKTHKWEATFTGENGWQLEFLTLAAALAIFLSGAGQFTIL